MKLVKVPFSGGSLGVNQGCIQAPNVLARYFPDVPSECISITSNIDLVQEQLAWCSGNLFLGGDHSITYGSYLRLRGGGLIIFDAHPDVEEATMSPSHEDFVRLLLVRGLLLHNQLVYIGLRQWSMNEEQYLRQHHIASYTMTEIRRSGVARICSALLHDINQFRKFHVSVDIDVVDPTFAPGTGYPEPGGLTTAELLTFLGHLRKHRGFAQADLVEINPHKDLNNRTISLGVNILQTLL